MLVFNCLYICLLFSNCWKLLLGDSTTCLILYPLFQMFPRFNLIPCLSYDTRGLIYHEVLISWSLLLGFGSVLTLVFARHVKIRAAKTRKISKEVLAHFTQREGIRGEISALPSDAKINIYDNNQVLMQIPAERT